MARKLNEKDIKGRIKVNKKLMMDAKKAVSEMMSAASKGQLIDPVDARSSLAVFIKSSTAVIADNAKLVTLGGM